MNGGGVINGMVGPGRGAGAAKLGGGLPCLPTPFPLLLSAPCHLGGGGGVSASHTVPSPQGTAGRAAHRPMAAQGWQDEGSRDRSEGAKLVGAGAVGCWRLGE